MPENESSSTTARIALLLSGALLVLLLLLLISGFSPRESDLSNSAFADAIYTAAEALTQNPFSAGEDEKNGDSELSQAVDAYIREHNEKNRN